MKKVLRYFIPFFLFGGIQIFFLILKRGDRQIVPVFVGKNWNDLPELFHGGSFSFVIGGVKTNKAFEHNYILEQYPSPGALVKKNQKIVLILNDNNYFLEKHDYKKYLRHPLLAAESSLRKEGIPYKSLPLKNEQELVESVGISRQGIVYLYPHQNKKILFIKNNIGKNCKLIENKNINKVCYSKNNEVEINCSGKIINNQMPASNIVVDQIKEKSIFLWHND